MQQRRLEGEGKIGAFVPSDFLIGIVNFDIIDILNFILNFILLCHPLIKFLQTPMPSNNYYKLDFIDIAHFFQ